MDKASLHRALAQVDEIVIGAMNEQPLAGLAFGIVHGGRLVHARGFGLADIAEERPVTLETIFRVGSISKTFTAIGLLRLWEQGRFHLDEPVDRYLKHFRITQPAGMPPVTFTHLLTHTAGIGETRGAGDLFRPVIGLAAPEGKPAPAPRDYYADGLRSTIVPGTRWAYANHAFNVIGQLVEDISGLPFFAYMREHVFDPLGMSHTDYERNERTRDALAVGYSRGCKGLRPVKYLDIAVSPAGSIFSSVDDVGRYVAALLAIARGKAGGIVKPETLALMLTPHFRVDKRLPAMGLAFWLDELGGHRLAGHDGGWHGFVSSMLLAPDDDLGVVVFTNTSDPIPIRLANDLLRRLLEAPDPVAQFPRAGVLEAPHLWPDLLGAYGPPPDGLNLNARVWMGFGGELDVIVKDNHLALRALAGPLWKGVRLYPVDPDDPLAFQFVYEKQAQTVVFKRAANGRIDRLCLGFDCFGRRPHLKSARFLLQGVAVEAAGLALAAAIWQRQRLARRERPAARAEG